MILLDTDTIIDIQRGYQPATIWFTGLNVNDLGVSGYVILELIQDARNNTEANVALKIIQDVRVLWPSESEYNWVLDNFQSLHLAHGVGIIDALIAATAISYSATLYTFNVKHYRNIPGLAIDQPYVR